MTPEQEKTFQQLAVRGRVNGLSSEVIEGWRDAIFASPPDADTYLLAAEQLVADADWCRHHNSAMQSAYATLKALRHDVEYGETDASQSLDEVLAILDSELDAAL